MFDYKDVLKIAPFAAEKEVKSELFLEKMNELCAHHQASCAPYRRILNNLTMFKPESGKAEKLEDVPFVPVRLFKLFELRSVEQKCVFKTMTSSGTSGQAVSKIFLDKDTASNQQRTLVKIVSDFTGATRMPMIIVDSPSVIKDRKKFSARGAGILGFSMFGTDRAYALDDNMNINFDVIDTFLEKHRGKNILLFGFTFIVWQHFYEELKARGKYIDLSKGILIHGGGWKKLANEAVSKEVFKSALSSVCGLQKVHDYYGMVEQTGCIYMECERGHLHASGYSDVLIRNPQDFSVCQIGEKGLIQLLSLLPKSYPGHSILSEDEGVLLGEDDCPCGRKGKYFTVLGRIKNAEIRGCSDTYERR